MMIEKIRQQTTTSLATELFVFIVIAYAISWSTWWPLLTTLKDFDGDPSTVPAVNYARLVIGAIGPSVSCVITVLIFGGKLELKKIFARVPIWRIKPGWYLYALFLFPTTDLVARLLYRIVHPGGVEFSMSDASLIPISFAFALVSGALMEELGWRGYLQPKLRERYSIIFTAVTIGLIWAFWHAPLFYVGFGSFVSGTNGIPSAIIAYCGLSIAISLCMVWLGENTRQSVFLAYVFHVSINVSIGAILLSPTTIIAKIHLMVLTALAVLIGLGIAISIRCAIRRIGH